MQTHHQRLLASPALQEWYSSVPGRMLSRQLQDQLDEYIPHLFGYYAVQIGSFDPNRDLFATSKIMRRFRMEETESRCHILGSPEALPLRTDCLDLVILPHVLEFSSNPHQVLREVDRALVPDGHLLIIGFNPFGIGRLCHTLRWRMSRELIWHKQAHYLSSNRLREWLSVLGFDILECTHIGFRPLLRNGFLLKRLQFMEQVGSRLLPFAGTAYIILARKRVATITPVRLRWRPRHIRSGKLSNPTVR